MTRSTRCLAAVAATLLPLAVTAQEHAVKIRKPGVGDKTHARAALDFQVEFKILDKDGNTVMDSKETKAHKFAFREAGLERAEGSADLVKLRRHYEHAERNLNGTRHTLPYQGKTVLIEKKDGKFTFKIEESGEELEGKDAEELHEEFNKGDFRKLLTEHFLPRKAVKVGESWKYDVAPLAKAFSADGKTAIDAEKSTGVGRLVKAYDKGDRRFGVVELVMEFPVTHLVDGDNRNPTKEGKLTIKLEADTCIDGTVTETRIKGSMGGTVRAEVNVDGQDLSVVITLRAGFEDHRTPAK